MKDVVIGIGGAAGDGLDKSGDTLAKTASHLGLHVYAYNSYQSLIRGGHIWLRIRLGQEKVETHGDHLNALIALNQDSFERHAPEVDSGGAIIFNADKIRANAPLRENVTLIPLPIGELTKSFGRILPVMQNTVALGALIYLLDLDFHSTEEVFADTFGYKGTEVVEKNIALARAGYEFAKEKFSPLGCTWTFSKKRRPFITGNVAYAMGAVAAGCNFYSAYPMTPATTILHWMAARAERLGVVVKQCEDELAVVNVAIGASFAGARAMCATSGGGFALMTEGIGLAAMIEAPLVVVTVQRGGPSTGIPTKTEQADLNQVLGASQGDFPRIIIAPTRTSECFDAAAEAMNLAAKYQLPVIILSDLLLSEHPETIEPEALQNPPAIERGELVTEWNEESSGRYKRFEITPSGISPRALPGTEGTVHIAGSDEHDEEGILISDVFTNQAIRRKMAEKRMKKVSLALGDLPAPKLEGSADADVTLIGWGSTWAVIHEAAGQLEAAGVKTNHLHFKYLVPFHVREATEILQKCKKTICVEVNSSGQFARHLRAETGYTVHHQMLKYDGEPFEPRLVSDQVQAILAGEPRSLDVTLDEAREITLHYIRTQLKDDVRPGQVEKADGNGHGEPVWEISVVDRDTGETRGRLRVGVETGSTFSWQPNS